MQCEVGSIRFLMEAVVVGVSNIDTLMRKIKMGIDLDGIRGILKGILMDELQVE